MAEACSYFYDKHKEDALKYNRSGEMQTESQASIEQTKDNQEPKKEQKDDEKSKEEAQPQAVRRVSFQVMAIESTFPESGLLLTTSSGDRVRDLRNIQRQISEILQKAESAMDYFARDDLASSGTTEKTMDCGGVKDMLKDYEMLCNEREKVLFSLDHFFSTSRDDTEFGDNATAAAASDGSDSSKSAGGDYNTREFTEAMMTARGAAVRLKDLNSEIVALAQILKRATLKDLNLEDTPLVDLQSIMQAASQSSFVAEAKVVEAQVLFKKLVEVMDTTMKDNAVLMKTNRRQEKHLDACLARNAILKSENQQLKVIAKIPDRKREQQQKEIDALTLKAQAVETKLKGLQEVVRLLEESLQHSESFKAEIDELKTKLEAANNQLAQEKQLSAIKSVEEKGIETDDLAFFESNYFLSRLVPTVSVSVDDHECLQGHNQETKDKDVEEADDRLDLMAENNDLRTNLEMSHKKIRNLEEIIRQMYYGRQRQNNGFLLPELPQPKKALTSSRRKSQDASKRTPTQPKLLTSSQSVDFSQPFPPAKSMQYAGGTSGFRRGSQMASSVTRMPSIEQLPRRGSFSPQSSLDNGPSSLLRIRSVTQRECRSTTDYFELQMDSDGNSTVLGAGSMPRRGSRHAGGGSKGPLGVGTWRVASSLTNDIQSSKPDW